jgi:ribonucleoside-diphosphate reductase beta chain
MQLMPKKLFNENGSDEIKDRQILGGNSTGIFNLNTIKYTWASKLVTVMQNNFWLPNKVSLVEDRLTLKELSKEELHAVKNTLSFLIALDSLQVANVPVLSSFITAPEISALFTVQEYQELVHSQSYQYILQELFPNLEREKVYNNWRTNPLLLERNKSISNKYQAFSEEKTLANFKLALAADFALEGIYFYAGFNLFYQLASRNKMVGCAKMIKYIESDEVTHVSFISQLIREVFDKEDYSMLEFVIREAVDQEIAWGQATYSENILGISKDSTEKYIKYLGNQRAKVVGLGILYEGYSVNPYAYLSAAKKENFFESTVTEYSQSTAIEGWDEF